MLKRSILVADTDGALTSELQRSLNARGYFTFAARDPKRVLEVCSMNSVDVVLLEAALMRGYGPVLIRKVRESSRDTTVIIMSEFGEELGEVHALQCENLVKPFSHSELELILKLVFRNKGLAEENAFLRRKRELREELSIIAGTGSHSDELLSSVARAVEGDHPVLIQGEDGTGKETVARIVHSSRLDNHGPFVTVSCRSFTDDELCMGLFGEVTRRSAGTAEVAKGKVELADGGTLYIGGIECAPPSVQILLIHLLEENAVARQTGGCLASCARLIFGAPANLEHFVETANFRPDLYYRLRRHMIPIPALRTRRDSIPFIVRELLKGAGCSSKAPVEIGDQAMQILCEYEWPGNTAELESYVSYAAARSGGSRIEPSHLPSGIMECAEVTDTVSNALEEVERRHISTVLDRCAWNKHRAARELEISKSTLYSKISKYRLQKQTVDTRAARQDKEQVKSQ